MDRHAHQRGLDDRAALEGARELVALEARQARPQPDVHGRRVLRLQAADPLQRPGQRVAAALQQQLTREHGAVELALAENAFGADGHAP